MKWSDKQVAKAYIEYLESPDDHLRRELLDPYIFKLLSDPVRKKILDLGCGDGYLTAQLSSLGADAIGVDVSEHLLQRAVEKNPGSVFRRFDLETDEVFDKGQYDAVVANMVLMDFENIKAAFFKVYDFLKSEGSFIFTITNPYYAYPAGVWKRNIRNFANLDFRPSLFINNYFVSGKNEKSFLGISKADHFHRQLSEYINSSQKAGLKMNRFFEPKISDALLVRYNKLDLAQRLNKVPLYLIFKFIK